MRLANTASLLEAQIGVFNYRHARRIDWGMALIVLCLAICGILTLVSASRSISVDTPIYLKQMVFFGLGCGIALIISCTDFRFLVSIAPIIFLATIALLVGVHFFGTMVKGGQRWLDLGLFRFQPSEFAKLAFIFMMAWYLATIGERVRKFRYFVFAFVLAAVPALLILIQPNLGTAAAFGPILFAMLYAAGCNRRHLALSIAAVIALIPVVWAGMEEYQRVRVQAFLNPSLDSQGSGYHTIQSMITVGSGGLSGKGYYQGTQTFLSYLPEHHNDFIFSLLAEEWGFAGGVVVLGLFGLLFMRGLNYARDCSDMSGTLLAVGIVVLLAFHVFVNVAITLGMMPVTGIPLPFLSYGGSFYLATMVGIGVLLSVRMRKGMFDH